MYNRLNMIHSTSFAVKVRAKIGGGRWEAHVAITADWSSAGAGVNRRPDTCLHMPVGGIRWPRCYHICYVAAYSTFHASAILHCMN